MGFSVIGLILALAIFLPSILFMPFFPPQDDDPKRPRTQPHRLLALLEKLGQAGCIVALLLNKDGFKPDTLLSPFAIGMYVCILAYYLLWIRYVVKGRHMRDLFGPLWILPVPLAVLPVLAFLCAAVWSQSLLLACAACCLAVGHIRVTLHTYTEWKTYAAQQGGEAAQTHVQ